MRFVTLIMLVFITINLHAVDFVIKEVQDKFDEIDASLATKAVAGSIDNADIASDAAIAFSKLAELSSGKIIIGNGSSVPTAIAENEDGLNAHRVARATWDFAVDGGAQGAIGLGVTLPAKSIIEHAYFYTVTQVVDGGTGTGALHCEDANNLYSAADVTGNADGTLVEGIADGTTSNFVKDIASACELTWTIAGADATAGKLIFFVHYTVAE